MIQIITIATGSYKKFFPKFLATLKNFFPEEKKALTFLTDTPEEKYENPDNIEVETIHIFDLIYPCINLNKPMYINSVMRSDCDSVFCIDVDTIFIDNKGTVWKEMKSALEEGKVILTKHPFYQLKKDAYAMGSKKEILVKNMYTANLTEKDIRFSGYISDAVYTYINSAFFGANTAMMRKFCDRLIEMARHDLTRHFGRYGYHIPNFIDENYVNKLYNDFEHKKRNSFDFMTRAFTILYDTDNDVADTTIMFQKNIDYEKTNRQ